MTAMRRHHGSAPCGSGVLLAIRRFVSDHRGVGAIEFALVAPVLLILYIGSAEVSVAMSVNRKVAQTASTVADLATQATSLSRIDLGQMNTVASAIMAPNDTSGMTLKVSEIALDASAHAKVEWSWAQDNSRPYSTNSSTTVPTDLAIANSYLIRVEVSYPHRLVLMVPGTNAIEANTLNLSKTYYLRPRSGQQLTCSDC